MTKGMTPEQWADAQKRAAQAKILGSPITATEAIQAATGPNPKAQTIQRLAEQSDAAGPAGLTTMMQNRPAANDRIAANTINNIAPPEHSGALGGELQQTAEQAMEAARQQGTAAAKPFFDSARQKVLSPAQASATVFDPALRMAIDRVRKDPLNNAYGLPADSVAVLDAAERYLGDIRDNAASPGVRKSEAAANAGSAAERAKQIAIAAAPEYADALRTIEHNRKNVVNPMQNGPVGALTQNRGFQNQANLLFPEKPMDYTAPTADKTVRTLSAQSPDIVRRFAAQYLRDMYNGATQTRPTGENVKGAADFAGTVAGNRGQRENLIAVLKAAGANTDRLDGMLKVFDAQQYKPAFQSTTVPNLAEGASHNAPTLAEAIIHPMQDGVRYMDGKVTNWTEGMAAADMAKALVQGPRAIQDLARANGSYSPMKQQALVNALMAARAAQAQKAQQ